MRKSALHESVDKLNKKAGPLEGKQGLVGKREISEESKTLGLGSHGPGRPEPAVLSQSLDSA